jgi:mannose-1-phosphate guanylyltransferase
MNVYPVILAGGKGERFWPLSTPETPKPFLRFFSEKTLLQQTYDRARKLAPADHIFVVAGEQHASLCREQLPELRDSHLLLEPCGRDTAAAIGFASLALPEDALMLVMPADHLIPDSSAFVETVQNAAGFISEHGGPGTFGIQPLRPDTNYGYIQADSENLGRGEFVVHAALKFTEKPSIDAANQFIRSGSYYWNSGIFLWRVSRIRQLLERHLPELWQGLQRLQKPQSREELAKNYALLPRISIDYGVLQKADNIIVFPSSFEWDDIGTWSSLLRILPLNADSNLVWGGHTGLDTTNCIIYAESHTIATAGIRDLVIVQRGNQTLICHKNYADRLKELLAKLPS